MKPFKIVLLLLPLIWLGGNSFAGLSLEKQPGTQRQSVVSERHSAPMESQLEDTELIAPQTNETATREEEALPAVQHSHPVQAPTHFSKKERRAFKKGVRKAIFKNLFSRKKGKKHTARPQGADQAVCLIVAIFIPPLGVYLWEDSITTNFWISLILWFLGWVPGIIWAFLVILGVL